MASPYTLTNADLEMVNCSHQDFALYVAFLNPVAITTTWHDLNLDNQNNWQVPGNVDTAATHIAPYQPIANMGSNRIGFVGEPLYFDGSRSCVRHDLPAVSYAWTVQGGQSQVISYAGNSQCAVSWNAPGLYSVTLAVKDRAGTTTTTTRQVMIYQDRGSALPGVISLSGLSGSLSGGGWQCQLTTVNAQVSLLPPESLPVGTYLPIVVMAETRFEVQAQQWTQSTIGPHGHFNPGSPYRDPRIVFDGYVQQETIHEDADKDTLSFSCMGLQMIMQETQAHLLGFYNAAYTSVKNGVPQGCKPSKAGKGFLVGSLTVADVIQSIMQYHTNLASFHDLHMWRSCIPTKTYDVHSLNAFYDLVYTSLSVTEGSIWQNMSDLSTNEWMQVYVERDGSLCVGPQVNYRGADYWTMLTLQREQNAGVFLNALSDLGITTTSTDLTQIASQIPIMPAQPMPLIFVHPWNHAPTPTGYTRPFQGTIDPSVATVLQGQMGPPILCTLSDVPTYDNGVVPPGGLTPHTMYNWPQDLSVYYTTVDISATYTGRTTLVKLIGTLNGHNNLWSSWWPRNTFQLAGNGQQATISTKLAAGAWEVNESHLLPDVTVGQNAQLVWNWWWEMAVREYYAKNAHYTASVTLGVFTGASIGDLVSLSRQNGTLPPSFHQKLFTVTDISHQIDLTGRTWRTMLTLAEVTSQSVPAMTLPPNKPPKG